MTPKAKQLQETVAKLDQIIATGTQPYVAMSVVLSEEDWMLAYIAFKTLVKEAAEA